MSQEELNELNQDVAVKKKENDSRAILSAI